MRLLLFPVGITLVAFGGCSTIIVYDILMEIHGPNPYQFNRRTIVAQTMFGLTILLCWYVTALICGRLWYVRDRVIRHTKPDDEELESSPYMKIILVLVESGALYSVWMLAFLVAYCATSTRVGWVSR